MKPAVAHSHLPSTRSKLSLRGSATSFGQSVLRDLAGRRLRQARAVRDESRNLEAREVRLAMSDDALGRHVARANGGFEHDVGLDLFAARRVGHRDGGGFDDLRQGAEDGLDFARGDVLAGAADHVLDPPDDVEIAAFILAEKVAGPEPAAWNAASVAGAFL